MKMWSDFQKGAFGGVLNQSAVFGSNLDNCATLEASENSSQKYVVLAVPLWRMARSRSGDGCFCGRVAMATAGAPRPARPRAPPPLLLLRFTPQLESPLASPLLAFIPLLFFLYSLMNEIH
ncbi:unnamed protein product [Chrysodeixis includens]|uniref:Uncharacterized protein n=1 Tax=Chrysodeixis includens TaxID=689277 RepID=A0A9N8PZG2_CHRIL|nr:unnamed protein product [Chrysodeixis includens]